jgi:hypothetical protein
MPRYPARELHESSASEGGVAAVDRALSTLKSFRDGATRYSEKHVPAVKAGACEISARLGGSPG